MSFVLDASAMMALLLEREGVELVRSVLIEDEAPVYAHSLNVVEVFYNIHQRGALAAWLSRNPVARVAGDEGKADLTGVNTLDASVFDPNAGNREAQAALRTLDGIGVRTIDAMDAALWQDAARLKSQFRRVSLADCFGVALARRLDAEFVTSDRHELEALDAAGIATFTFIR